MKKLMMATLDIIFPVVAFLLLESAACFDSVQASILGGIAIYFYNAIRKKSYGYYMFMHP
jgi:hypothetical protein